MNVTEAVAAYEAALAEERRAGAMWMAARDCADREMRIFEEHAGGGFGCDLDAGGEDLLWVPKDAPSPELGILMKDAPAEIQRVAERYQVAAAFTAWRAASARWSLAARLLLIAPRRDDRDLLEKFRALSIERYFVVSRDADTALAMVRRVVEKAEQEERGDFSSLDSSLNAA